jgi:hypothetical protein
MEYEDRFHPSEGNDLLENDAKNMLISQDKGYHKLKRLIKTHYGMKSSSYVLYSSGDIGSNIRDAITGQYYAAKVGSKQENQFFKMSISTGELKGDRRSFYFSTPEDYERHMYETLDQNSKQAWEKRRMQK